MSTPFLTKYFFQAIIKEMKLPKLYHLGKGGKLYSWEIWTEGATIYSSAGTDDGKKIPSSRLATPKNEGKANATTASEQADKEAMAMHKFKLDRKYSLTPEDAVAIEEIKPMLALDFKKRKDKISYPVDISPKLDGCRAISFWEDNKIVLKSRSGKEWLFTKHINNELTTLLPENIVLDGELYRGGIPFQTLMSYMKREQDNNLLVQYWIYDIIDLNNLDATWLERKELLKDYATKYNSEYIKFVLTEEVINEQEVLLKEAEYVSEGWEGAMVRLHTGKYESGYRSSSLLKCKSFQDEEFKITGFTEGLGKFKGCIIFICETNGKEFKVVPKATEEQKKEMFKNGNSYIGKLLTVKYFGLSEDNVPRFPVGRLRLEEDLDK